LKVVTIQLPPLRERREDIPELAGYFLERYNHEFGKRIKKIDEPAIRTLQEYHWPGNIRQLESVIEKAVLMCEKDVITTADIAGELVSPKRRSVCDIDIPENGLNFEEVEKELLKKGHDEIQRRCSEGGQTTRHEL